MSKRNDRIKKDYGHLIKFTEVDVPEEHRHKNNAVHSLRCFGMVYQRNEAGEKDKDLPKRRCKRHVVPGYLYCPLHGGKKSEIVIKKDGTPATRTALKEYRKIYDEKLGSTLDIFINDPDILDIKPELAQLRLIMKNYIETFSKGIIPEKKRTIVGMIQIILNDDEASRNEKYDKIEELILNQQTLHNGGVVDRIVRLSTAISALITKITKIEVDKNFALTPAGLRRFLRILAEIHKKVITNETDLEQIRSLMMEASVETSATSDG